MLNPIHTDGCHCFTTALPITWHVSNFTVSLYKCIYSYHIYNFTFSFFYLLFSYYVFLSLHVSIFFFNSITSWKIKQKFTATAYILSVYHSVFYNYWHFVFNLFLERAKKIFFDKIKMHQIKYSRYFFYLFSTFICKKDVRLHCDSPTDESHKAYFFYFKKK